jgi:hypothetical protein
VKSGLPKPLEDVAPQRRVQLTARDLELLEFAAEHRLLLGAHVQACLGVSAGTASARLRGLSSAGYLRRDRFFDHGPGFHQITTKGLSAIQRSYGAPQPKLGTFRHDVGLAWLWLAARAGTFGPMHQVVSERAMRSHDGQPDREREPLGVRLGGFGAQGRDRLHYPDLLLVPPDGRRLAIELELTTKTRARRDSILAGYAADRRIDGVLYLVERRSAGDPIRDSARRLGICDRIHVQGITWDGATAPARERVSQRVPARTVGVER